MGWVGRVNFVTFASLMKKILLIALIMAAAADVAACTSAVVSGKLTRDGRPLLWKHRDTGTLDNFVAKVDPSDGCYGYVALFNKGDITLREAWVGMNDAGFAVMNTASYNLAPDTAKVKDREGIVMSEALRRCRKVEDFARLLDTLPKPLGVQANFGVIDGDGNGGYFETDDYSYRFFPVGDSILVRTNFSVSGGSERRLGTVRYDNAIHLLGPHIEAADISAELLTDTISRSFYYSPDDEDKFTSRRWLVYDRDFIPRYSTSASVVIEGGNEPVMWTVLGYPPCGIVSPATPDSVPSGLSADPQTGRAPDCDRALQLKETVFTQDKKGKGRYVDLKRLRPLLERCVKASAEVYRRFRRESETRSTSCL